MASGMAAARVPPSPAATQPCAFFTRLSWVQGVNSRANTPVETWKGSKGKQSFTYIVEKNATVSFTWAFQRTTFHEIVSAPLLQTPGSQGDL